jgi:hypothetical protein
MVIMESEHFVRCALCGAEHDTSKVKFLDVEEDPLGRDVMHFECPITGEETCSLVYRGKTGE